ncbi:MAG TPA: hypothetical protein VG755_15545 [Nannocystaceae bacterium]|nr:hypothetical protein [Nannocystaceae bacterium]
MPRPWGFVAALLVLPCSAAAATLVPGPGQMGHDAELAAKIDRYDRQLHGITTVPLGWGLEAFIGDPTNRMLVDEFVVSDFDDFEEFSGLHPYAIVDAYEEFGDLGMFGGVQAAGDALRYAALRDEGADAALVDAARDDLLAAMDGLHIYHQITGVPGVIARGVRRITPLPGEPPLPGGAPPATTPLFDEMGNPLPVVKDGVWRDDNSGELPDFMWHDDTSKDQEIGYVLALGAVYETVAGDPTIPQEKIDLLVEDARALATSLMTPRMIGDGMVDLVLMDADGRPTAFHDLAAEELTPGDVHQYPVNPFNAVMALGTMRTLYQITGDEEIGRYYYEELIDERGYLDLAGQSLGLIYFGNGTNYSNVNMAFCAIYPLLRYEPELELAMQVRSVLEAQLYGEDGDHSARGLKQTFFDFVIAGFGVEGTSGIGSNALVDGLVTLVGHPDAPYWDDLVENCDAAELDAGECIAIDGSPITIASSPGWGGGPVADDPLPIAIRPPSNFAWRSDPHDVNGGGSTLLNPGGEIWFAYWLGRRLNAGSDGLDNIGPGALGRPMDEPPADTTGGAESSTSDGGESTSGGSTSTTSSTSAADSEGSSSGAVDQAGDDGGCGCTSSSSTSVWWLALVGFATSRRRLRRTSSLLRRR